jgi:hypothetical protein
MAVSVRLDPLLEKEVELSAKRQGITKSQFIIAALERALGRKDPYKLLLEVEGEFAGYENNQQVPDENLSPMKAAIRAKLRAKHEAQQADWVAFQDAKKRGETWRPEGEGIAA